MLIIDVFFAAFGRNFDQTVLLKIHKDRPLFDDLY